MTERPVRRPHVLDAGALIAYERRDRKVAGIIKAAAIHRVDIFLPSAVLAQVWRDGARQALLAMLLRNPRVQEAPLNHDEARRVGELLRISGTSDVVDAHVALLAERLHAPVITSDPGDIGKLSEGLELVRV